MIGQAHLSELRVKWEEAGRKLRDLREAGDDAMADLQAGMKNAWKELKSAVDKAKTRLK
jgi:hypothetical protein